MNINTLVNNIKILYEIFYMFTNLLCIDIMYKNKHFVRSQQYMEASESK